MAHSVELLNEAKRKFITGHPEESIDMLTKAEKEGCNPVLINLSKGAAYISLQNFDEAIENFDHVLGIDVENERAYYYRGIAYLNKGNFDMAIMDLSRSIMKNNRRGAAFLARGMAYAEIGKEEEAIGDFKTAVSLSSVEVENFGQLYGNTRTLFDKSMALLEGDRGPWRLVLTQEEIDKLKKWMN